MLDLYAVATTSGVYLKERGKVGYVARVERRVVDGALVRELRPWSRFIDLYGWAPIGLRADHPLAVAARRALNQQETT